MVTTPNGGTRPDPDPSRITTENLDKAMAQVDDKLKSQQDLLEAQVDGLHEVMVERLKAINGQFVMIESRRVEQKSDTSESNAAALACQREISRVEFAAAAAATAKAEQAFSDALRQQAVTTTAEIGAIRSSLEELKDRLGRNENGVGRVESGREGGQQANSMALVLIGTILTAVVVVATVIGVVAQLGQ